jgi:hypothetical protein
MYLFYNLFATLHVSNDYFVHHQESINLLYLHLCRNHANVPNCSVLRLEPVQTVSDVLEELYATILGISVIQSNGLLGP